LARLANDPVRARPNDEFAGKVDVAFFLEKTEGETGGQRHGVQRINAAANEAIYRPDGCVAQRCYVGEKRFARQTDLGQLYGEGG